MAESNLKSMMETTMEKMRGLVDAETIIGDPIVSDGVTIIPVSKVSFGLATGGSDFPAKSANQTMFGGGSGAGVSVTPVAFLVVKGTDVELISVNKSKDATGAAIEMIPELFEKVKELFAKLKEKKDEKAN